MIEAKITNVKNIKSIEMREFGEAVIVRVEHIYDRHFSASIGLRTNDIEITIYPSNYLDEGADHTNFGRFCIDFEDKEVYLCTDSYSKETYTLCVFFRDKGEWGERPFKNRYKELYNSELMVKK